MMYSEEEWMKASCIEDIMRVKNGSAGKDKNSERNRPVGSTTILDDLWEGSHRFCNIWTNDTSLKEPHIAVMLTRLPVWSFFGG